MAESSTGRLVVAITGASGAPYALRFLQEATRHYKEIYVALSDQALQVISLETGRTVNPRTLSAQTLLGFDSDVIRFVDKKDYFSPPGQRLVSARWHGDRSLFDGNGIAHRARHQRRPGDARRRCVP